MGETTAGSLSGQTAVVTGASRGIGRAIAWHLAAAGARTIVHAHRSQADAQALVEQIRQSGGQADAQVGRPVRSPTDSGVGRAMLASGRRSSRHLGEQRRRRSPDRGQRRIDFRRQTRAALAGRRAGHHSVGTGRGPADAHRRGRDPEYGMGSGRNGDAGRQWRDVRGGQGSDHGLHSQPGQIARAASPRQLSGAGLDPDPVGRAGLHLLAAAGAAGSPAGALGNSGRCRTRRFVPGFVAMPISSPDKCCRSTEGWPAFRGLPNRRTPLLATRREVR